MENFLYISLCTSWTFLKMYSFQGMTSNSVCPLSQFQISPPLQETQGNSRRLHGEEPRCLRLHRMHRATPRIPASDLSSPQGCQATVLHTGCPNFASDFRLPPLPSPHNGSQAVTLPGPQSTGSVRVFSR